MQHQPFSFRARIRSFRYAFAGIATLLKYEHNARIHAVAALCAVVAGISLDISQGEWIAVIFAIATVFAAEAVNSAIEYLADFISPARHELIGKAKDMAAAAVLLLAIAAAIIATIIFVPKILILIKEL